MSWEWSHTNEAYSDAYENLHAESREFLEIAFAEWHGQTEESNYSTDLDLIEHDNALAQAKTLANDTLADFVWEKAQAQRLCDNGGWNAWCCPYGCHTVSFSCESTDD